MQSITVKCDLAPKLSTIAWKPCCIKYCRHTVKVKTNSLYYRPKGRLNKIWILQISSNLKKTKFNILSITATGNVVPMSCTFSCLFFTRIRKNIISLKFHFSWASVMFVVQWVIVIRIWSLTAVMEKANSASRYHRRVTDITTVAIVTVLMKIHYCVNTNMVFAILPLWLCLTLVWYFGHYPYDWCGICVTIIVSVFDTCLVFPSLLWILNMVLNWCIPAGWSAWLSGRTSVSGQRSFAVLRSTCTWRVTTYMGRRGQLSLLSSRGW